MLGRQQIAGIPTAIHELFKNAYDAFAQRVRVDVIMGRKALVLRDDGYGMTEEEFRGRWLTIGTESRLAVRSATAPWLGEYARQPRRIMGEKGIGRLAIAAIGPAVLVMTRAKRPPEEGGLHDLVVCLVHWGFFEQPGIDVSQVRVPILRLPGGTLPTKEHMLELTEAVFQNAAELEGKLNPSFSERLLNELAMMEFSPKAVLEKHGAPSLEGEGYGTTFIVRPYDAVLDADILARDKGEDVVTCRLQKLLVGFGNSMMPDEPPPPIAASFFVHYPDGVLADLIAESEFFTPDEYKAADHAIEGTFDEHGQFTGQVRVFDGEPVAYTLSWGKGSGRPTHCGPFRIRFGYIMGQAHETLLPADDFLAMGRKLDRYGGLYMYRDGIRVLPYGDADYDFLHIERRRTLKASDWFFSYRRIFGAVLISSANCELQEKAGREGFQENLAYRQFRSILVDFFMSLAKDFFRTNSPLGDDFNRIKQEMEEKKKILDKHKARAQEKKKTLAADLVAFFDDVDAGEPTRETEELISRIGARFTALESIADPDELGRHLTVVENEARSSLDGIRRKHRVKRPTGIGLPKDLLTQWRAYLRLYAELEQTVFAETANSIDENLSRILRVRSAALDRRLVIRQSLDSSAQRFRELANDLRRDVFGSLDVSHRKFSEGAKTSIHRLHTEIQTALSDFEKTDLSVMEPTQLVDFQGQIEQRIATAAQRETDFLGKLRSQLDSLAESIGEGTTPDDLIAALEDSNENMAQEAEAAFEWAQLGMALGILQHEFQSSTRRIRRGIQQLRPWAKGTPELRTLFSDLSSGFTHLEEYLRLFTPLDRRLHRQRVDVRGQEVYEYLSDVFQDRLQRHGFQVVPTDDFRESSVHTFMSTILPVFVNLVDNACYWLAQGKASPGKIVLDVDDKGWIVADNGPGIESKYADLIFDFGFTTKTDGRGMGLTISRRALQREGMDLVLLPPVAGYPVRFQITFAEDQQIEEEGEPE